MLHEVDINMMHESSLTTVAMLAAYIENMNGHYLDLLVPFVEYCLPDTIGTKINLKKVSEKMASEFGIENMPENLIEAILKRYIKNNSHACIEHKYENYTISRQKNNNDFDARRQTIQNQMDRVTTKFRDYISQTNWRPTTDNPKNMLLNFFRNYGLELANKNVEDLYTVSVSETDNFIVAKFILWAEKNDLNIYNALISLTKGFLTYRAIYQLDEGEKKDHQSKLKNVKCFLDCSLIINLLGYDTPESKDSIDALVNVIRRNKGEIWVFEHTIEEAQRLLSSYANSDDKMKFRLPGLKAKHYHDSYIRSIASNLCNTVEQKGLRIYTVPLDIINNGKEKWNEFYTILKSRSCNESRSESDFCSITGIKHIRNNLSSLSSRLIEYCSAILITQDISLVRAINKQEMNKNRSISFAKLDTDIAALLWLQTFEAQPNIPEEILLCNAAAAVSLSDEVRERAIELIKIGEKDGTLSSDMVQALRSDRIDELLLAEYTGNDPDRLTKEAFTQSLMEVLKPDIEQRIKKREEEKERQHEKQINELNQSHQEEIERERTNSSLREAKREQEHQNIQYQNIDDKAIRKSRAWQNVLKIIIFIVVASLAIVICKHQVNDMSNTYFSDKAQDAGWCYWLKGAILILFTISSTIFIFVDKIGLLKKAVNRFGNFVYKLYRKYYERMLKELNNVESNNSTNKTIGT